MQTILEISSISLWIILLFNLFLTFALIRRLNSKDDTHQEVRQKSIIDLNEGDSAPDFTAQILNGESITLANFVGHKIVLIFISTHCKPCEELLPNIKSLKDKAMQAGVELFLVSTAEVEATRVYVEEEAINLPLLVAPRSTNTFISDYKVNATPAFCFITAQGSIYRAGTPYFEGGKWKEFNDFLSEGPKFVVAKGGKREEASLR